MTLWDYGQFAVALIAFIYSGVLIVLAVAEVKEEKERKLRNERRNNH